MPEPLEWVPRWLPITEENLNGHPFPHAIRAKGMNSRLIGLLWQVDEWCVMNIGPKAVLLNGHPWIAEDARWYRWIVTYSFRDEADLVMFRLAFSEGVLS